MFSNRVTLNLSQTRPKQGGVLLTQGARMTARIQYSICGMNSLSKSKKNGQKLLHLHSLIYMGHHIDFTSEFSVLPHLAMYIQPSKFGETHLKFNVKHHINSPTKTAAVPPTQFIVWKLYQQNVRGAQHRCQDLLSAFQRNTALIHIQFPPKKLCDFPLVPWWIHEDHDLFIMTPRHI